MRAAYQMTELVDARNALFKLHDELLHAHPSAAGSLAEGLEETLTVTDLRLMPMLRQALATTNGIESGFSIVEKICRQVKRWQGRDHRLRWIGSALLFAESRWNRLRWIQTHASFYQRIGIPLSDSNQTGSLIGRLNWNRESAIFQRNSGRPPGRRFARRLRRQIHTPV